MRGAWLYERQTPGGFFNLNWIRDAWDFINKLTNPQALNQLAGSMGIWLYVALFVIIFVETGLVVMPFLPGDSLLFAAGAIGALEGNPINLPLLGVIMTIAAILGDAVNYSVGFRAGPAVFNKENSRWFNKKHLLAAQTFYERHGGKTIILARFLPFVRTFAPFVAGIGRMSYPRFAIYNVTGAVLWVSMFMGAGRLFGGIPWVQKHIESLVIALIVIPGLPAVFKVVQAWLQSRREREV
ncbi:MAG: DedA family protein [Holophagales bacterium]|nr:DedA family protein [Holophagales bacterium]